MKNSVLLSLTVFLALSVQVTFAADNASTDSSNNAQSGQLTSSSASQATTQYDKSLQAFEQKLFGRTFDDQSAERRLDRIELALYGSPKSGPIGPRMDKLLLDAPLYGVVAPAPPIGSADQQPTQAAPDTTPDVATAPPIERPQYIPSDYGNYPTVTALEEKILGQTYLNMPVQQRLAQMETKAFGQASNNSDLSFRVDQLKRYVGEQNNNDDSYLESQPQAITNTTRIPSILDVVSQMENEVYGKTYGRDTLMARIDRLDKSVFNDKIGDQTFTPLVVRIRNLQAALSQNKISASPNTAQYSQTYQSAEDAQKKSDHPVLHKLGKFLGGVGTAAGIALGSMAAGSMMGYGYGYGYGGWGYPYYGGIPFYGGYYGYRPGFFW